MKQIPMDFEVVHVDETTGEIVEETSNEPQIFSVSDLNRLIKEQLEGEFPLVWIRGEVSNFKPHTSGHFYFSLKDRTAQISAVMFRGFNQKLKFRPEDGMEVLIRGKVTVYEPRGNYQIFCEVMEPVGAGALQAAYEQLKKKLESEGLFDPAKKRPIPPFPQHVALVTSPTGAAVRDMLNVLSRRNKNLKITVVPCVVQGDQAAGSIVQALERAQMIPDLDVIICGRGGGSIEDMWAFNMENVARAIAKCRVPTISAVGHEIDFTIADFVADLRAPTPSAAAELVSKNTADVNDKVAQLSQRLKQNVSVRLQMFIRQIQQLEKRLIDPRRRLQDLAQRCDDLEQRLTAAMSFLLQRQKMKLDHMRTLLDSLSPLRVLDRGYAIVKSEQRVVRELKDVKVGGTLDIQIKSGRVTATVESISKNKESN